MNIETFETATCLKNHQQKNPNINKNQGIKNKTENARKNPFK